jgi:hypothetical protein
LYDDPSSPNPGHSCLSGANNAWIYRVTESWNEGTVTWNNQPAYTTQNGVALAQSIDDAENFENIDVTALVQDMLSDTDGCNGFMLKLDNEEYYRSLIFASSDAPDPTRHPKLKVCYSTNTSISEERSDDFKILIYPNPSSEEIYINYELDKSDHVSISVFDQTGRLILVPISATQSSGKQLCKINIKEAGISRGVYHVMLKTGSQFYNKKIIVR